MGNNTTVDGGTVLTVPAGKTFDGCVSIAATLTVSVGGAAATRYPRVSVSGSGGNMDDGDVVVSLALSAPAVGLAALTGFATSQSLCMGNMQVVARDSPVSLVLTLGAGVAGTATACGEIY